MNSIGGTPLHEAASHGNAETVQILIVAGADIHTRDKLGRTPLHAAAGNYDPGAVHVLTDLGADVNPRDNEGQTPLAVAQWYARIGDNSQTVQALISSGAE